MSTRGPAYVDPLEHDDTELGAAVRAAYAEGHNAVLFTMPPRRGGRDYETTDLEGAAHFERYHAPTPEPEDEYDPDERDTCARCGRRLERYEGPLCHDCRED